jgi:hypothetical protein
MVNSEALRTRSRHAAHLAQLAPRTFRKHVGLATNEDAFEALLDSGELDAAALFLLPSPFNVERDANGVSMSAATKCALLNCAFNGNGETIADAVLGAWTTCLLALAAEFRSSR